MKKQTWLALALAALMLLSLTACGNKKVGTESLAPSDYLPDVQPPLDIAITDCLSAAEVSTILGVDVTASDPYEEGTWVIYSSEDGMRSVSVSMENTTIALYDAMIGEMSGKDAENSLGYRAYWYGVTGEMINYCEGYSIAVSANDPNVSNTRGICQMVMKKIVDNLQSK
jgi:predicted small lipoprotein YifL